MTRLVASPALRGLFIRQARGMLATLVLAFTSILAGVALLGVSGWFLTGAALTTAALSFNLFGPSALVRGLSFLRIGARYGEKLVGHDVTLKLLADLRAWLFAGLIPRVPLHGASLRHGDLVSRLVADVEALDTVFITAIGPGLTMLIGGAILGTVLWWLVPTGALIYGLGFAAAVVILPALLVLATRQTGRRSVEVRARLRMAALDGIEGHADLRAFDGTSAAGERLGGLARDLGATNGRQSRAGAAASAAVACIAGLTALGVLTTGLEAVQGGRIMGPMLVGLVLAVLASFEAVGLTVRNAARFGAALAAADRLRTLVSARPAVLEAAEPVLLPPGGDLVFDDVGFAYRRERVLLERISLRCPSGSRTAISGESGSGKSTLLDLALRLADPDKGTVRVAGRDIAEVAQADVHARIALMGQSTPVFLGTIRDNLLLGRLDAGDVDLRDALAHARLVEFVESLPEALDTWCGEGGRTLSVGQARRLCLARTLLTRAAILLLDEPTSGLDHEGEQAFLRDLAKATAGRTVLLVTHAALPPGTVDRTFRLADGHLTEVDQAVQPAAASSERRSAIVT